MDHHHLRTRVLYVTSEIAPFLRITSAATAIGFLPAKLQEKGYDIRIFMPKFGVINERRNRLHEVVRLSGINIRVAGAEKPLTIKVASLPTGKLQVYFLDNEDYFKRKSILADEVSGLLHPDNDERAIFFCKGVIETVRKLGWSPNIIHCHGWMTSFIPLYLRTFHKEDPMFKHAKTIFTAYNDGVEQDFGQDVLEKVRAEGPQDTLDNVSAHSFVGISIGGMSFSDVVVQGHPQVDAGLEDYLTNLKAEHIFYDADDKETFVERYHQVYARAAH